MRLKVLFIPTWSSGVTFYRMFNFWKAAHRTGLADFHVLWWQKDLNEPHPWQRDIHDPGQMWRITKEMQDWCALSDVVIIGTLSGTGTKIIGLNSSNDYVNDTFGIFKALRDTFPSKVILTECDDNVISTPEWNPAYKFFTPEAEIREITLNQFKESDGLIVSTPYLKEIYTEFNSSINVIPNCIDFKIWDKLEGRKRKGIRIGWGGGANHEEDLRIMEEVISPVIAANKDVKFVFVHGCPHYLRKIKGVEYISKWVPVDKWPKYLASQDFDIGIAPLVDNAFNRSKSNLKWLEYSALKIPTVASNVGHFKETINTSDDGMLVNNKEEWISTLNFLIRNKNERKLMGKNAYARIRENFNVDKIVKLYIDILKLEVQKKKIISMTTEKTTIQ
jgi:glycosyltransferase involved in cell wall biosynthesis